MRRGRPPAGSAHVMTLVGSADDKHRLRVLLDVTAGELTVNKGCQRLGLSAARLHQLRRQALQGALDAMGPKPLGRPLAPVAPDADRVRELKQRVEHLEGELQCALVRTEIALAMPQLLLEQPGGRSKKNASRPTS